jgi:hypothetical protein
MKITIYFCLVIFCVFANISHSFADETITLKQELSQLKSQFQEMKHLYGQRIKSLETEIETINTQKLYRDDNAFLGQTNLPKSSLTAFNPEIGMIVDSFCVFIVSISVSKDLILWP